ncbi:MAG: hypothetical protein ABIT08_11220 [Bacteroidia bacterium]
METFTVQLTPLSRLLLISAFSTAKFTLLHEQHPLEDAIYENELINEEQMATLYQRIKNAKDTDKIQFSLDDEILIYTVLDVTCKTFLTNIGDEVKEINQDVIKSSGEDYAEVRNTLLKGCQVVMEGMRTSLSDNKKFMARVRQLNNLLDME